MTVEQDRPIAVLLSPVLPQPGGSGRALRAWDWLTELAATHEVHVWSAEPAAVPPPGWPAGARLWSSAADLRPASPWLRRLGWAAPRLCTLLPAAAANWHVLAAQPPALGALSKDIGARPIARLVVFRLYLDGVAGHLRARHTVQRAELDLDDVDSATIASVSGALRRLGRPVDALLAWRDARQYRLLEGRIPGHYDRLWLATADDLPGDTIACRYGVRANRLHFLAPRQSHADGPGAALLFVGSLDYPPNEEAAMFLADRVVPLLKNCLAEGWTLTVAGRRPPRDLRARLSSGGPLRLLADAPDLSASYAAASIALLPLFAGGGTKFKTLEAFAHGLAVVASAEAVRGMDLQDGVHFIRAETPVQFADAVVQLARSPALRERLAEAGHAWSRARCAGACPAEA